MKKAATFTVACIGTLLLAGCTHSNTTKKSAKDHYAIQQTPAQFKHDRAVEGINLANFNRINIGNINDGTDGSSQQQVIKLFGNPEHVSRVFVKGVSKKTTQYIWKDVSSSFPVSKVKVQFLNHLAVGKSYFPTSKGNIKTIPKAKIKGLHLGTTYQSVIDALGTPNGQTIVGQGPLSGKYLLYAVGRKGSAYDLTFTDDKLNNKFKTSIY
ncbi:DUF3862 domain-containing protein [Lentilactobacillus kefiri]|uniref:Lipoprotein n=2 Tax=Lentilactobacillus kefiri TaxID=33962 RepID=A0A8E1V228_LENKE|nr:DUF3862 domain-containing protein [Lentilactobacillus kefiri]KRL56257.1 hypothetical protein FD08_GL004251 [Lentilactobacillus parakefiri DSM 10551]KRM51637.1 hypothetical protein FC95_GL001471 [Lentilactobacillus kefiri DSM 20587 = JCM 5818]MCJ2162873.1 DUF3862 domain-containing protein [Lentilactobacillus kefiri]MCP9369139.1 DUF3862 domain-containing protein [Lentilactobacillus kefiri]MDH5108971.1 DUF3862 domain-containing protein [Lentilactobacillus kefiri]